MQRFAAQMVRLPKKRQRVVRVRDVTGVHDHVVTRLQQHDIVGIEPIAHDDADGRGKSRRRHSPPPPWLRDAMVVSDTDRDAGRKLFTIVSRCAYFGGGACGAACGVGALPGTINGAGVSSITLTLVTK